MKTKVTEPSKKAIAIYGHHYVLRALVLVGFLVFALVGFSTPKEVTIRIDNTVQTAYTSKAYVSQLISEFIDPNTEMMMNYDKTAPLVDEMEIVISTPKTLTLQLGNMTRTVTTSALQVQELLVEENLTEQAGYSLVNANVEDYLAKGMMLTFDFTTYTQDVITESIAATVEYVEDDTLLEGSEEMMQTGIDTVIERTYNVRTVNETIVERTLVDESIITQGQPTIIHIGTKQAEVAIANGASNETATETPLQPIATLAMKMTFYGCQSCGSASGVPVDSQTKMYQGMRILSADWSILPAGSIVNVPGWGKSIVLDTGVSGNHIDMFIGTDSVPSHGVEYPTIEIIRLGW
ncbi:MAG: G5 domain-containing protein [Culicoidibacterales bacterium]